MKNRAHRGIVMFAMGKREQIERADRIKSRWRRHFPA